MTMPTGFDWITNCIFGRNDIKEMVRNGLSETCLYHEKTYQTGPTLDSQAKPKTFIVSDIIMML